MSEPWIQVDVFERPDGVSGKNVGPSGKETGLHLRHLVRIVAVHAGRRRIVGLSRGRSVRANHEWARWHDDRIASARIVAVVELGGKILASIDDELRRGL